MNMHVHGLELSLIVVCRLCPSSRTSFTISGRVAVSSCHAGMIVTDPELGADGIGVPPPSLAKHADVNTMTTWSRMAWIGTTWSPGNTIRATTLPVLFRCRQATINRTPPLRSNFITPEPTPAKFVTPVMPPQGRVPTPRAILYVTCLAWTSGTWFRSYTGALPTGCCDHLLTGDS